MISSTRKHPRRLMPWLIGLVLGLAGAAVLVVTIALVSFYTARLAQERDRARRAVSVARRSPAPSNDAAR